MEIEPQLLKTMEKKFSLHRRFDRMGRLVGHSAMKVLAETHVVVVGVGGVGSFAAESLARSGVGKITLVDYDEICVTNLNRQIHALSPLIGEKKVKVMADRLRQINPQGEFIAKVQFCNAETVEALLTPKPNYVIDAIDNLKAKCVLLDYCRKNKIRVVCSGGAGSRLDPLAVEVKDLSETSEDPFLAQIRKDLRTKFSWPSDQTFGIPTVFSREPAHESQWLPYDGAEGFECVCPQGQNGVNQCDRKTIVHGTASFVVGSFGLALSSLIVGDVLSLSDSPISKRSAFWES
ncbi:MAG: ThiF family adenylyltransferase [Pseudobdellovibrionaceae bacterium]